MKTRIIVDSTADLVPEIKARVSTVPLTVHFGQEEYIDGVTIDNKTFYEKLIESDVLPTTSQATPDAFIKEFEKARQAGESAVVITLASKFSGTYQSAVIAAADYANICVVDGTSAAMGTGILVELAFRLLEERGMSAEDISLIVTAIGNHDEGTGVPVNAVAAALILADKCDVRRSRVRNRNISTFDIHDRVNMSIKKNYLTVDNDTKTIRLVIIMNAEMSSIMDYFEIYLSRMILCEKAAKFLGYKFELVINGAVINNQDARIGSVLSSEGKHVSEE